MGATEIGAAVGGAIDAMDGDDDSIVDGAVTGAIVANVIKYGVPALLLTAGGFYAWHWLQTRVEA